MRGFVYVMTNPSMPNVVKIGFSMKDPAIRAADLSGTSVPTAFILVYDALVDSPFEVEHSIHAELRNTGLAVGKEFFQLERRQAVSYLRDFIQRQGVTLIAESASTAKCLKCSQWTTEPQCICGANLDISFDHALGCFARGEWDSGIEALEALKSNDPRAAFELALARMQEIGSDRAHRERWRDESLIAGAAASDAGYVPATRWLERVYAGKVFGGIWSPDLAAPYAARLPPEKPTKIHKTLRELLETVDEEDEPLPPFSHVDVLLGL